MYEKNNTKYVVIGLLVLVALLFTVGASRIDNSQYNGRFQLVVSHADRCDFFVIDTATGQIWTNKYKAPDYAKSDLYKAKLSLDQ